MATSREVAEWMVEKFDKQGYLIQEDAALSIRKLFGEDFVYLNDNGGLAIDRGVLRQFRKLTDRAAVWVRSELIWRKRDKSDVPGRQQD
jgi:hypothetical protein